MRAGAVLAVLAAVLVVATVAVPVFDDDFIAAVNRDHDRGVGSWRAARNSRFAGMSLEDAARLCGARGVVENGDDSNSADSNNSTVPVIDIAASRQLLAGKPGGNTIPASFDARTKWPGCIHPVRDQAQCGSCWAFATAGPVSDRLCIKTAVNVELSPQHMVSCETDQFGCDGGYLDRAWLWAQNNGIVEDVCYPYTSLTGITGECAAPVCPATGQSWTPHRTSSTYRLSTVSAIQTEIMNKGPVTAGFNVYNDFFSYSSGIYVRRSSVLAGGHAVALVGWGASGKTKYWIARNSWGTGWGMSGYVYIKFGECGIENNVYAGDALN